ncbi:hypothetical protein DIPPA_07406 [Diplonema papillatum]|nr:hypothetical protein DIPPA_07406 [Diplonema papillatum]
MSDTASTYSKMSKVSRKSKSATKASQRGKGSSRGRAGNEANVLGLEAQVAAAKQRALLVEQQLASAILARSELQLEHEAMTGEHKAAAARGLARQEAAQRRRAAVTAATQETDARLAVARAVLQEVQQAVDEQCVHLAKHLVGFSAARSARTVGLRCEEIPWDVLPAKSLTLLKLTQQPALTDPIDALDPEPDAPTAGKPPTSPDARHREKPPLRIARVQVSALAQDASPDAVLDQGFWDFLRASDDARQLEFAGGEDVVEACGAGRDVYFIACGAVSVRGFGSPQRRPAAELRALDFFGELSLFYGTRRTAACAARRSRGPVRCFRLAPDAVTGAVATRFPAVFAAMQRVATARMRRLVFEELLGASSLLRQFAGDAAFEASFKRDLTARAVAAHGVLFRAGETADCLFFPVCGSFELVLNRELVSTVSDGVVGGHSLVTGQKRAVDCELSVPGMALVLGSRGLAKLAFRHPALHREIAAISRARRGLVAAFAEFYQRSAAFSRAGRGAREFSAALLGLARREAYPEEGAAVSVGKGELLHVSSGALSVRTLTGETTYTEGEMVFARHCSAVESACAAGSPLVLYRLTRAAVASLTATSPSEMSAVNDVLTAVPAAPAQADLLATGYLKQLTRELRILQSEPRDPSAPLPPAVPRFELADKLFEGRRGVRTAAHVPPPASVTKEYVSASAGPAPD